MTRARKARRRQRAMATRQALSLCEAELPGLTWDGVGIPPTCAGSRRGQPRISALTAKAALRAAGVPPYLAAALHRRLRLIPEQEAER